MTLMTAVSAVAVSALTSALAVAPVQATTTPALSSYTVRSGDTVYAIAERFGLVAADVLAWNGLNWRSVIHPGQTLVLAAPASSQPASAPAETTVHTVVAGDTIYGIAQQYATTVDAVLAANGFSRASIIYPGQTIRLVPAEPDTTSSRHAVLNAPQAENAALIIRIGREVGVPDRGIAIALATSMVESWLRNLDGGDRDSLGLFQQRPSTGWGTPDQIGDRGYSIRAFFLGVTGADGTTTRGLLDVPGWENMAFADAAQAVQISAHPDRYGAWESAAYEWLALYG